MTCLAVTVSLVIFYLTVHPGQLHTTKVPAIGTAAFAGALYAPLVFALPGLVTAFAVARAARGTGRTGPCNWRRAFSYAAGSAFIGLMIGATTWDYVPLQWSAVVLGVLGAVVTAAAVRYAYRTGRNQNLRRSTAAGLVVAVMAGLVVYVEQAIITENFVKGLVWARTWVVLTGLTAAIAESRDSGRADHPAVGAQWRARKGALGALALGAVAVLVGELVDRQAFGQPLSVLLGVSSAVEAVPLYGLERARGDTAAATGPATVLARDRHAALLLTLVTGVAVTVLTGISVTTWNASYELLDTAADKAVVFGDGLSIGPGIGIAAAVGLAITAFGVAWPRWLVARGWLVLRGRLPLRLMSFLDDAHQRGVLRQADPSTNSGTSSCSTTSPSASGPACPHSQTRPKARHREETRRPGAYKGRCPCRRGRRHYHRGHSRRRMAPDRTVHDRLAEHVDRRVPDHEDMFPEARSQGRSGRICRSGSSAARCPIWRGVGPAGVGVSAS